MSETEQARPTALAAELDRKGQAFSRLGNQKFAMTLLESAKVIRELAEQEPMVPLKLAMDLRDAGWAVSVENTQETFDKLEVAISEFNHHILTDPHTRGA